MIVTSIVLNKFCREYGVIYINFSIQQCDSPQGTQNRSQHSHKHNKFHPLSLASMNARKTHPLKFYYTARHGLRWTVTVNEDLMLETTQSSQRCTKNQSQKIAKLKFPKGCNHWWKLQVLSELNYVKLKSVTV